MAETKKTTKKATKKVSRKLDPLAELQKAVEACRKAGYDVSVRIDRLNENGESEGRYL